MATPLDRLASQYQGFRERYLSHDAVTAQLHAWASAFPDVAHLRSIGRSAEGRDLWLLTLGPEPERARPSAWVDGNMHASELCGSSVALAIAEDLLRLHLDPSFALHGLAPHVCELLRGVRVFVLPRMSPDGAEAVLQTGRYVRSNPRDHRPDRTRSRWLSSDVNGDGLALLMRRRDPTGEFVESSEVPGLMLPRRLEDAGPFYKVYPEGTLEPFDGHTIPDPDFLSDNDTDLNRNFPWSWMPEPEQEGAGRFAGSEPESRAVVEFVTAHPEIFAWLNLHTFGGVYIRPLGHAPDKKLDPADLALFRQIGEWGESLSGYPMVSGFEEFLYEPDKPLHGDLADFAFHQRGAVAFVCELWDLFRQLGIERKKPFADHYTHLTRDEMVRLGKWDREHNEGRVVRPWVPFAHPQLGQVEVGGVDTRVGLTNPPYEVLGRICAEQTAFFLRLAALAPDVRVHDVTVEAIETGVHRVRVRVSNGGYLPTYVVASAKTLPWNETVHVRARGEGCSVIAADGELRDLGHLEGWGRGLCAGAFALYFQRSRGSVSERSIEWLVRGSGSLVLSVGSCRLGWTDVRVNV